MSQVCNKQDCPIGKHVGTNHCEYCPTYMRSASTNVKCYFLQMAVCPTPASLGQGAPVSSTAPSVVASVHLATPETASLARTLMSVKRFSMPATFIMESTCARTQSQVITVCPALRASLALSPLGGEWSRRLPKNRYELLHHSSPTERNHPSISQFSCTPSRFANPVILARMEATTATKMQTAFTWASTASPCSAASANLGTQEMVIFVERTVTWTGGPTTTWSAWRTPPTTARR